MWKTGAFFLDCWFSKCGSRTNSISISISGELVRNANWGPHQGHSERNSEWDPVICVLTGPPGDSEAPVSLRTSVPEVSKFHCQRKQGRIHMCSAHAHNQCPVSLVWLTGTRQIHITSKSLVLYILNPRKHISFLFFFFLLAEQRWNIAQCSLNKKIY